MKGPPRHPVHEDAIAVKEDEGDDHEEGVPVEDQVGVRAGEATHEVPGPNRHQDHHGDPHRLSQEHQTSQFHNGCNPVLQCTKTLYLHLNRDKGRPEPPQVLFQLVHLLSDGIVIPLLSPSPQVDEGLN